MPDSNNADTVTGFNSLSPADWEKAEAYFHQNPQSNKLDKYKLKDKLKDCGAKRSRKNKRDKERLGKIQRQSPCSFIRLNNAENKKEIFAISDGGALGAGGCATVKLIKNKNGDIFALKIEHPEYTSRLKNYGFVIPNESHILKALGLFIGEMQHHGRHRIHAKIYRAMPYYIGTSLDTFLGRYHEKHQVPYYNDPLLQYILAIEIAKAVKTLHDKYVIHGDLHPGNIIVNDNNGSLEIKIIDFGLSYQLPNAQATIKNACTHGYDIAPEVKYRERYLASDIYTLKSVLANFILRGQKRTFDQPRECYDKMGSENPLDRPNIDEVITGLINELVLLPERHSMYCADPELFKADLKRNTQAMRLLQEHLSASQIESITRLMNSISLESATSSSNNNANTGNEIDHYTACSQDAKEFTVQYQPGSSGPSRQHQATESKAGHSNNAKPNTWANL